MDINLTVNDNTRATKEYIATLANVNTGTPISGTWVNTYIESITAEVDSFDSGNYYTWGSTSAFNVVSSIYIKFTPTTTSITPQLCSFNLSGAAITTAPVGLYTSSINITSTEWPSDTILGPHVRINYESTVDGTSAIWRQLPPNFNPTVSSMLITGFGTVVSGYSIFEYSDGTEDISTDLINHNDNTITYTTTNSTSTVTHVVSNIGIMLEDQLFNYTKEKAMTLNFVDLIPTASFITYPSSAWNDTTWLDVSADYTLSLGASAYGSGHTEVFNLSALQAGNAGNVTYSWDIGSNSLTSLNSSTTSYSVSSPNPQSSTTTLPVSLGIFTSGLPVSMPEYHYEDISGSYVQYDNFNATTSDNSNVLFQHIRMVPLNTTSQVEITSVSPSIVVLPFYNGFTTALSAEFVSNTLINISDQNYDWTLTNPGYWTITYSNTGSTVSYNLSVGDQSISGQINPNQLTNLTLSVVADLSGTVTPGGGSWPVYETQASDSESVSAFEYVTRVYLTDRYSATSENVTYQNASHYTPILSATFWDDGISSVKLDNYSPYVTQYNTPATYDLSVSSVLVDGSNTVTISASFDDVSVIISEFESYSDDIIRIFGSVDTDLPIGLEDCKIPPNEWCEADNINRSLERLNNNFIYLKNIAQIYNAPPTELYGWFGDHSAVGNYWHVNIDSIDTDYNTLSASTSGFLEDARDVITDSADNIYVINDTTVQVLSSDWEGTQRYSSTGFNNPVSLALNSNNRLYILDKGTNEIIVLNEVSNISPFTIRTRWGGLGGANSKSSYNNPNDIYISDGYLWVVDSGNKCIKKYTEDGAWIDTIQNSYFDDSEPISIASDLNNNIHVILENNNVIKMQADGTYISTYTYPEALRTAPKRIRPSADGGFLYICLAESVIKVNKDGIFAGQFATDIGGTKNYQGIYQDEHRNTFLANGTSIVKYIDIINAKSLNLNKSTYEWLIDDIRIDRDEFNENWVYNRAFARLWDNLELFRRSLIGKPGTVSTQTGIDRLVIIPFGVGEYTALPYNKSQIYIGVNEIVTADVINRCIEQLHLCEQTLISLIS